ncbi:MAG: EAL domain-containing protein [Oscillospiraceae bacterium]
MGSLNFTDFGIDSGYVLGQMLDSFDEVLYVNHKTNSLKVIKKSDSFFNINESEEFTSISEKFQKILYPDDISCIENINLFKNKKYKVEIRVRDLYGKYRWCYLEMIAINDYSFMVMLLDLTSSRNEAISMKTDYFDKKEKIDFKYGLIEQKYKSVTSYADVMIIEMNINDNGVKIFSNLQNNFLSEQNNNLSYEDYIESDLIFEEDKDIFGSAVGRTIENGTSYAKVRFKSNNDRYFWCDVHFSAVYDAGGSVCCVIATAKPFDEISGGSASDGKLNEQYDKLTGLYDGVTFCRMVKNAVAEDNEKKYALILFDIEKFKIVNELYGFDFADEVLEFIAFNMRNIFKETGAVICHFMSDFFGIFTEYDSEEDLIEMVKQISSKTSLYKNVPVSLSFGIHKIRDRSLSPRLICDYANMAKKTVKGNRIVNYAFYTEKIKNRILEDKYIENEMEYALKNGQFSMYLQPKYNISTSEIIGAEALVRWVHPKKGLIMPDKFIPLFEKNGFIVNLDKYIWEQACIEIRKWIDSGQTPVPISVNVSRVNVGNPKLIEILDSLVEKYKIDKKYLELEITETVYYDDQNHLIETLNQLKKADYTLLMDDFGSGFSSLNMLKNTPFDILKIDRNFLNETMVTDKGKKIILHTISLSNDIGINTVAEGVETKEQAEYLLECGCNVAQGYYYSKPVELNVFDEMFHKN